MQAACERAKRSIDSVRVIAVTKSVEVDVIRGTIESGLCDLGESRAQELVKRAGKVNEHLTRRRKLEPDNTPPEPRWHMIGHLQRNKVRPVLPWTDFVHSLDSLRLAEELSEEATRLGRTAQAMIQVNVSGEKSKYGIAVGATTHLVEHIASLPNLQIVGLMTMAPHVKDPEESRPNFRRLRELFEEIQKDRTAGDGFKELSMGMSNDYEIAIEEGATMIRLGSALYDGLTAN